MWDDDRQHYLNHLLTLLGDYKASWCRRGEICEDLHDDIEQLEGNIRRARILSSWFRKDSRDYLPA